jgi:hypothetical protein
MQWLIGRHCWRTRLCYVYSDLPVWLTMQVIPVCNSLQIHSTDFHEWTMYIWKISYSLWSPCRINTLRYVVLKKATAWNLNLSGMFWKELIRLHSKRYFQIFSHLRRKLIAYKDTTSHKVTEFYTEWFKTWRFLTIAIFKSFVKENNDSNKTRRYIHDLLQERTNK